MDWVEVLKRHFAPSRDEEPVGNLVRGLADDEGALAGKRSIGELVRALNDDEGARLAGWAAQQRHARGRELLIALACLQPGALCGVHATLTETLAAATDDATAIADSPGEGILFHAAGPKARDRLLDLLDGAALDDSALIHRLLRALAFIGDERVCRRFAKWRDEPPRWAEALHFPPEDFAHAAGWTLTGAGSRRDLTLPECVPLVRESASPSAVQKVAVGRRLDEKCRLCSRPLTALVEFDPTAGRADPRLQQLRLGNARWCFATCLFCVGHGEIFTEIDRHGGVRFRQGSPRPKHLPPNLPVAELPENQLVASPEARSLLAVAHPQSPVPRSQIGGHPTWFGEPRYPRCPRCDQLMTFVAQIDGGGSESPGKRLLSAFVCAACGIAASRHQSP